MSENVTDLGPEEPVDLGPEEPVQAEAPPPAEPTSLTAFRATRAGVAPPDAARALALSQRSGQSPQFVADNLGDVQQAFDDIDLQRRLAASPATAAYASQSAVHAAAVKDDAGTLEALERGLSDIGYGLLSTAQMTAGSPGLEESLRADEQDASAYQHKKSGIAADLLRTAPSIGLYFLAGKLGQLAGGKPGEFAAVAGTMYAMNRGVLYRRIMAEEPTPVDDADLARLQAEYGAAGDDYNHAAYEARARAYATVGSVVSASLGAGLGTALSLAFPSAGTKVAGISNEIVARAFTDPATRQVIARLLGVGGKTLSGALLMAVPAVTDNAAVQKAVSGQIDATEAIGAGWEAFKSSLLAAGLLATIPEARPLVRDIGRALSAPHDVARLDGQVEQAKTLKLAQHAPQEASALLSGVQTDTPTVFIDPEALAENRKAALAVVNALADEGQAIARAEATQTDVAVPIEKYLAHVGPEHHDALREDVKTNVEGMTLREAVEAADGWREHFGAGPNAATQESRPLPEVMAERYGGTPESWAEHLTPETVNRLKAAVAPEPRPLPKVGADDANALLEDMPIGEIHPGRFELAAQRAADKVASVATDAAGRAEAAARQGFLGAGAQAIGSEQTPAAGKANLREAGKKADVAQRRIDRLPQLEMARDLARHLAARAGEVRAEMDKARKYLDGRDTPEYRADLNRAGPEYVNAFEAVLNAVDDNTPRTPANPAALDTLLARMEREGHLVPFDEVALRETIASPKGWSRLTPPEARNVLDAVKALRFSARKVNEITMADRAQSVRDVVDQIAGEAGARKDLGAPPLTDSAAGAGAETLAGIEKWSAANLKPETIFAQLGETAHRFYEDKIVGARNRKAELQGEHLRFFMQNFDKEMRGLKGWLKKPVQTTLQIPKNVDLDGTKVNNETLAMTFLNLGTGGNEQRLLSGYGWDGAQVRAEIGKFIPREKLDLLQGILSYNDTVLWPLVRDHAERNSGVAPPKALGQKIRIPLADGTFWDGEGGYFPAAPNRRALSIPDFGTTDGVQQIDPAVRATVQASFTKERAAKTSYPIDLNWSRYPAHVASVFHYLAYDEAVRDMGKVLRDDAFRYSARHYVGEGKLAQLDEDLRIWARGSVGTANGVLSYIDQVAAKVFRSRAISNALAFSTPIALGQESHIQYAIASGQISLKNTTAAMTRQFPTTDTWVATRAVLDEVRLRSDRYSEQFREAFAGKTDRSGLLGHGVDRAAFAQMEAADAMTSHIIGDAAMNDALEAGMSTEDAVREANRKVRLLMPTHNPLEMAPIVRSRGTIGALMLFRGLPNVVWNVESGMFDAAKQAGVGDTGAALGVGARTAGRYALTTARAVASMAVLHVLFRAISGHGKKQEDGEGLAGWATWAEREALAAQFSRLPLGRDVAEPFIDAYFHDKTNQDALRELANGQHLAPDVAVIYGTLKNLATIASDAEMPEDRVQAAVETALLGLGIGGRQIGRTGRYIYDAQQGNVDVRGPGDIGGGLIYGQNPRQAKNPLTAAQDIVSGE